MTGDDRRGGRGTPLRGNGLKPPAGITVETLETDREYLVLSYPLPAPSLPEGLTTAEREVAILLVRGLASRAVAVERGVSVHTVENQIRSLYAKLGVSSRVELLRALRGAGGGEGGEGSERER